MAADKQMAAAESLDSDTSKEMLPAKPETEPEARITFYVVFACMLTSCGSFVMGYDAYILGGVEAFPDFLLKFYPSVLTEQASRSKYCYYDDPGIQWLSSVAFLAGLIVALPSMFFINKFGRRPVMFFCGVCFVIALVIKAAAENPAMLYAGRAFLGAAAAFSNTAIQVYCVEMAPPRRRARLGEMFQVGIASGAVLAPLVNAGTKYIHPWGWRLSFAIPLIPALLLCLGGIILPDTPNSLLMRRHPAEARKVLERIRGTKDVDIEYKTLTVAAEAARQESVVRSFTTILKRPYRPNLYLSASATLFQIWTGVNFINFFGIELLVALGLNSSLVYWLQFAGAPIGLMGVFTSVAFTDRIGRRATLVWTTAGMCASFVMVGLVLGIAGTDQKWVGWLCIVVIWLFGYLFNVGWGAVATMYPTEINPLETRAAGQAVATFNQNIWNFVVARTSLSQLCTMQYGVFFFLAGLLLIMGIAVFFFYVEPAGELERIQEVFQQHWFWKRWHQTSKDEEQELDPAGRRLKAEADQ